MITSLIGAVMGLGLGGSLAALVRQAISDEGMSLVLPLPTLAGFTRVAVLASSPRRSCRHAERRGSTS